MGRVASSIQDLSSETVVSLQELVHALRDSINYHNDAAQIISDDHIQSTFRQIARERAEIAHLIDSMIVFADGEHVARGTVLGSLRNIWLAFRGGLNAGDPVVVLIEAERAEDAIVKKFKKILPDVAGSPISDKLRDCFKRVRDGHSRVVRLRDAYQNA